MTPITSRFPEWAKLPFLVQLRRNLEALSPRHRMHPSPDWQNVRVEATIQNRERLALHEKGRRRRLEVYWLKQMKRAARSSPPRLMMVR